MADKTGFIPDDGFVPYSGGLIPAGFISDADFISDEEKYGTPLEQVKTAAEAAARGATFGLSDQFLTKAKITTPEAMKARKEENPWIAGGAELAGVVGPAFVTGGTSLLPGAVERLGVKAGAAAAELGAGKVLSKAAALGAEGAVYGVGQSISENALGDHDLVSQESLANIGLGGILGAGLGGITSKLIPEKSVKSVVEGIEDLSSSEAKLAAAKMADAPLGSEAEVLAKTGLPAEDKVWLLEKVTDLKQQIPGAAVMKKEFNEEGLPLVTGMFSKNETVRKWASAIAQSTTLAGNSVRESVANGFSKIKSSLDNIFEANAKREAGEAGDIIKNHILNEVEKRNAPFKALYEEREALGKGISLNDKQLLELHEDLLAGAKKIAKYEGSESVKAVQPFADLLLKQPNLSSIDGVVSAVGEAQRKAYREGSFEAAKALGDFVEKTRDFVNNQIEKTITKEGGSDAVIQSFKKTTKEYREFKQVMSDLVADTKLSKKALTASGLQEILEKIPSEKFLDKIFDSKNAAALERLKTKFPSTFETLVQQKKASLFSKAMEKDVFNPKQLIKTINDESKMSRGVRDLMFSPDQIKKMEVYKKWIDALPSKVGPSGTPEGMGYMSLAKELLDPTKIAGRAMAEVSTAFGKKAMDSILTPGEKMSVSTLMGIDKSAQTTSARISKGIGAIIGGSKSAAKYVVFKTPGLFSENEYKETTEKIKEASNNPASTIDKLTASTDALYPHAPNVTQAMQGTIIRGIQFLNSKIPQDSAPTIFQEPQKPSKTDIAQFQRYYDIVQDPLLSLKQVKDGTITHETIETLTVVWPKLYDKMKLEMLNNISSHKEISSIPYSTKVSIGMFLGQPVVPSLEPMSILANQAAYAAPQMQQAIPQKRTRKTDFEASDRLRLGRKEES